jgi:exopolyphosphatase
MTAVLRHAGLTSSDLLTLSELPNLEQQDTRWLLVDHNAPTGQVKDRYKSHVIGCIDHHAEEDFVVKDAQTRVIEPCGSCMSLVVDSSKEIWEALTSQAAESNDITVEDDKLAKLALAPILIDTVNLSAEEKVKPKDVQSVQFIENKIRDKSFDRTKFFDDISDVKADISQLSFRDIFRKDYKEWQDNDLTLGISSIVQNLDYLISTASGQDNFLAEFEKWAKERKLDIASIMTTFHSDSGGFQRELVIWSFTDGGAKVLRRFNEMSGDLKLNTWREGKLDIDKTRQAWRQENLAASRKQVAPLIRDAMKSCNSS